MPYPGPSPRLSEICYQRFSDLVRARSGIELPAVRRPDLEKAVMKTMDELGLASPEALLDYLTAAGHDGVALEGVVSRITVGETHFFRNQPQFAALEEHILPQLIEARRGVRRLRIWSAGCATGEEPYSLAIALQHCLPDLANWNVLILATDINRSALANAQKGVYGAWSFRETSPQFQAEYFDAVERKFVIKPSLRAMVTFAYLNLVEDRYPSMFTNTQAMDLIFCRNVLIYFSEATNRGVVERLGQCLTPGGWLVVGHAEPSQLMFRSFTVHNFPGTILYQKPGDGVAGFPSPPSTREKVTRRRLPDVGPTFAAPPAGAAPAARVARPQARPALPPQAVVEPVIAGPTGDEARRLKALAQAEPGNATAPYALARLLADQLDLPAAQQWVEVSLARDPLLAQAHYLHGLILMELGRLEESLEALRSSIYVDPKFLMGHYSIAGLYRRLGEPQRAAKALTTLEQLLEGRDPHAEIPDGDGLTIGRLAAYAAAQKEMLAHD